MYHSCNTGMRALPECHVLQGLCNAYLANSQKLIAFDDQSPKLATVIFWLRLIATNGQILRFHGEFRLHELNILSVLSNHLWNNYSSVKA